MIKHKDSDLFKDCPKQQKLLSAPLYGAIFSTGFFIVSELAMFIVELANIDPNNDAYLRTAPFRFMLAPFITLGYFIVFSIYEAIGAKSYLSALASSALASALPVILIMINDPPESYFEWLFTIMVWTFFYLATGIGALAFVRRRKTKSPSDNIQDTKQIKNDWID